MGSKTDKLIIKLTTDGDGKVKASLAGVSNEMDSLDRNTRETSGSMNTLKGVVGAIGFAALAKGLISANVEYQKLKASLKTVTGSQREANKAWADLEEFTKTTPFQLNEVVRGFTKLTAMGLDPSMAALRSYGNTASAMSMDLNQMIEAVADAATGEFERLKEFGIRASSEGDRVTFTFRGVSTTVQKEAGAIEGYLRNIGDTDFAGATTEQMDTLGGKFSNLSDSVSALARTWGDSGVNEFIADSTDLLIDLVNAAAKVPEGLGEMGAAIARWQYDIDKSFTAAELDEKIAATTEVIEKLKTKLAAETSEEWGVFSWLTDDAAELNESISRLELRLADLQARRASVPAEAPPGEAAPAEQPAVPESEGDTDKELKLQEHLQKRYAMLEQSVMTERELAIMKHEQDMADFDEMAEAANASDDEQRALKESLEAEHQRKLTEIAAREGEKRKQIEQDVANYMVNVRQSVANLSIGLMRTLGAENKNWALAALVTEKGLAIAEASMNTSVAYTKALTIDPTGAMASRVAIMGKIQIGLIAATGLAQAAQINSGGGAAGSLSNPVHTSPVNDSYASPVSSAQASADQGTIGTTQIFISASGLIDEAAMERITEDYVVPILKDGIENRDVVLISAGSRNAQELVGS